MAGAAPQPKAQGLTFTVSHILQQAGWSGASIPDALGVVGAESHGSTNAINPTPCSQHGDHAVGLFQVCTVHCGSNGLSSDKKQCTDQLQNPVTNAKVAKAIYNAAGGTFAKDWSTWQSGAAQALRGKDLPVGGQPPSNQSQGFNPGGIFSGTDALGTGGIFGSVTDFLNWLTSASTWLRVGKGILGMVLIVGGTYAIVFGVANKASGGNVGKIAATAALA